MVRGIAQRAVDPRYGFDSLSHAQKRVLEPFLTQHCCGETDPGDHHNGWSTKLSDEALLEAYEFSDDAECLQCESGFYAH